MTAPVETLLLTGSDVARSLPPAECREAIERAFCRAAKGRAATSRALGFETATGAFHAKATLFESDVPRFVAKINGNFPGNPGANGLPTIQGLLVFADASDGRPLAVMDSARLTAIRTAATTAVAARRLARPDARVAAIVGCGLQGAVHSEALLALLPFREIRLFDRDRARAAALAGEIAARSPVIVRVADTVRDATYGVDVVVTCTTGGDFVLREGDLSPGTFVAAVGADNPHKREIHPSLLRATRVVVDDLEQCAASGDLHHALEAGFMTREQVHADLAAVVAGLAPGRGRDGAIFVFDSTGIALEDAAAAEIVYQRAMSSGLGTRLRFAE